MKKVLFLILVLFLISCTTVKEISVEKQCLSDGDCVKATCCHADESVNKEKAPDCTGVFCTAECVPDTLDCGQGEIKCLEGKCEVVLS